MRVVTLGDLLIAVLLAAIISFAGGAYLGWSDAKSKGEAALNHFKDQTHSQQLLDEQRARDALAIAQRRAGNAENTMDALRISTAQEKQHRLRSIPHVTTLYKPSPTAALQPLPQCVFTAGFVHEYNAALGVSATAPAAGPATDPSPNAGTGTDAELLVSGITQRDILAHAADYGERCQGLEAQVNQLLDVLEVP